MRLLLCSLGQGGAERCKASLWMFRMAQGGRFSRVPVMPLTKQMKEATVLVGILNIPQGPCAEGLLTSHGTVRRNIDVGPQWEEVRSPWCALAASPGNWVAPLGFVALRGEGLPPPGSSTMMAYLTPGPKAMESSSCGPKQWATISHCSPTSWWSEVFNNSNGNLTSTATNSRICNELKSTLKLHFPLFAPSGIVFLHLHDSLLVSSKSWNGTFHREGPQLTLKGKEQ